MPEAVGGLVAAQTLAAVPSIAEAQPSCVERFALRRLRSLTDLSLLQWLATRRLQGLCWATRLRP